MSPQNRQGSFSDGTQTSMPDATFGDALSDFSSKESHHEFEMTRVAAPIELDTTMISEMVDAELAGEVPHAKAASVLDTTSPALTAEVIAPAPPLGMLPQQRRRPQFRVGR